MSYSRILEISRLVLGLAILSFGAVFLIAPNLAVRTIAVLLGLAIVLKGISHGLASSYPKNKSFYSLAELSLGVFFLFFGIIIFVNSSLTINFLGVFVIVVATLALLNQVMVCYERRAAGLNYAIAVIFGLIHCAFGILIGYSIFSNGLLFNTFIGVYLIVIGTFTLITTVHTRQDSELS